jgi:galactokinase
MNTRMEQRLLAAFVNTFDSTPTVWVQAPGRVNLIGEHTDYNDGFVLPCAIDTGTLLALRPRTDGVVRVLATDYGRAMDEFRVDAPVDEPIARLERKPWANYVRGVLAVMQARGLALPGANIAIAGDVPRGAGLSSSASLEVAVAQAWQLLMDDRTLSATDLALIAQDAENSFVGIQCGVMDQLISARGEAGHALLIDCRSLQTTAVPLPEGAVVVIVESAIKRGLVDSAYNQRRQQCEAAARHLGVKALRDADLALLQTHASGLDGVSYRRARHVITENQRTLEAADALRQGDLPRLGTLMAASHESMRVDFEITTPAIDELAQILRQAIGPAGSPGGARMTGGGFGGCVVAVMPADRVDAARAAVESQYRSPNGERGTVHVTHASAGAGRWP